MSPLAAFLAYVSTASFPGTSAWPGTHRMSRQGRSCFSRTLSSREMKRSVSEWPE